VRTAFVSPEELLLGELQTTAKSLLNPTRESLDHAQGNLRRAIQLASRPNALGRLRREIQDCVRIVAKLLESAMRFHEGLARVGRRPSSVYGPAGEVQYAFGPPVLSLEG
jgi:hypothetical protein